MAIEQKYNKDIIKIVISNYKAEVNEKDVKGKTPLQRAVKTPNYSEVVIFLLEQGSDVNAKNHNGETPLHMAAEKKHGAEVVKILTEKCADLNAKDKDGSIPLHWSEYAETATILSKNGANINSRDNYEQTPLYVAVHNANLLLEDALLKVDPGMLWKSQLIDDLKIDDEFNTEMKKAVYMIL